MSLQPLAPLAPLRPLSSGINTSPSQGVQFRPLFESLNPVDGGFGDSGGGWGFIPASGPGMGGNFPGSGCDPSIDPFCGGGCDPTTDPFCDTGGGGTVPVIIGVGGRGGGSGAPSSGSGGACSASPFFNFSAWAFCWLERLVILALGIAAIIGGIYLIKPDVINQPIKAAAKEPIKAAAKGDTAAAVAA